VEIARSRCFHEAQDRNSHDLTVWTPIEPHVLLNRSHDNCHRSQGAEAGSKCQGLPTCLSL
jgi:hypothetical protein